MAATLASAAGRRVVGQQRGEPLDDGPGRPPPAPSCRMSASTWSATGRMFLLLGRMMTSSERDGLDRLDQLGRRRVHRLAADDQVVDAERAEDAPDAVAARRRPPRSSSAAGPSPSRGAGARGAGALAHPPLLLDLLVEVGHPDALRPPGVQAASMAGADVVGVDVAVPQAVAADHDDGVARCRPRPP